ncbi:hypothetical protein FOA43_003749 [Brettanomyces nanus]|uniref:UBR-type domain-containing protein n=1 Tax=Eeniella nana TaxID=13502 RepID=A0A875S3W3_EENNA|nr:uncharacterized protein FOA43_003749 [Brettanomyces nanus]QPG76361.1 hypothetical protein FOA43_003749 [Brettanomyces nanus]
MAKRVIPFEKATKTSNANEDKENSSSITAEDYLENQLHLEKEARELMPYDSNQCTYGMGPLRQEVYACLTCYEKTKKPCGICFACSINCHSKHRLAELFTKRNFTCDCGTSRINSNGHCRVRMVQPDGNVDRSGLLNLQTRHSEISNLDIPSLSNTYNQNYSGLFCSCCRPYNPEEDTNMFQCQFGQACGEDWYHEECIMGLRPQVIDRKRKSSAEKPVIDISDSEESSVLPMPGFPDLDSFETIICWKCVLKFQHEFDTLSSLLECQRVYHVEAESVEARDALLNGRSDSDNIGIKRMKKQFPYTLLLKKDFKKHIKQIVLENKPSNFELIKLLKEFPYMYNDDPIYKPPEDSDDENSSMFELGLKNLNKVPVEQALTGMEAYKKMKSRLTEFLKPFAEQKKVVTEEEVKKFFSTEMSQKRD